jgi:hypothetical protein
LLAWTRDGTAVIYDATGPTSNFGFWRVTIDGNHAPERIETGGDPGATPAAARSRDRLAFTRNIARR